MHAIPIFFHIDRLQIPGAYIQRFRRFAFLADVVGRYIDTNSAIAGFAVMAVMVDFQHWVDSGQLRGLAIDVKLAVRACGLLAHQVIESSV